MNKNLKPYLFYFGIVIVSVIIFSYYLIVRENSMPKPEFSHSYPETEQVPLVIQGKIPKWLEGTFVRNGPVSIEINGKAIPHWFDGLAMLHAFSFKNAEVVYTNKFLRSNPYREVFEKGNLYFGGFATPDRKSIWEKIMAFVKPKTQHYIQNANVNIAKFAKNYVALTETPLPVHFDIHTMNTLGALEYQDDLPKKDIFESAHPQIDNQAKEQINYLIEFGKESYYVIYKLNSDHPAREVIAKIPVENPAYMHSFALTKNYIILVEFPFTVSPLDLILSKKGFIQSFTWNPKQGTNFIVIDRATGKFTSIKYSEPFFAFHHINAFEKDNDIVLDIISYPDAKIISNIAEHGIPDMDIQEQHLEANLKQTKLMRYTLSVSEKTVNSKQLLENHIEFPRINPNFNTQENRYIYLVDPRTAFTKDDLRPIYKIDTKTNQIVQWSEPGLMPEEPVFIANPIATEEDKGLIVTIVLDYKKQNAFLLVLDATTFKEIARCYTPHPIPAGLHGQFFEQATL